MGHRSAVDGVIDLYDQSEWRLFGRLLSGMPFETMDLVSDQILQAGFSHLE